MRHKDRRTDSNPEFSLMLLFLLDNLRAPRIDLGFVISATAVSASDTFERIKDTITAIVDEYGITDRLRYGLIVFGRNAVQKLSFSEESDLNSLKAKIKSSQRPGGEPNLQKALEESKRLFDSEPARPDVIKVLVVITDKKSTSRPEDVKKAVIPLEEGGVKIVPVAVGSSADPNELEVITSNREYLIKTPRKLDPDVTAEMIMEKVLKGISFYNYFDIVYRTR